MSEEQREVKVLEAEGGSGSRFGRREMLKKSAIAGGALVWAVPTVELIGTRVAAAQGSGPLSIGNCAVQVSGIDNLYSTTVTVDYATSSSGSESETITISSSGGLTFDPKDNPLGFSLNSGGTQLIADLASLADTPTLVEVEVSSGTVTDTGPYGSNCSPFTIYAVLVG